MANGAAIAPPAAIEPPPEHLSKGAPVESGLTIAIGEAAAAICLALAEFQAGGLSRSTRSLGGEKMARLYTLREDMTAADFADAVRGANLHPALTDAIIEIVSATRATMRAEMS